MTTIAGETNRFLKGELEPLLLQIVDGQASESDFKSLMQSLRVSQELRKRACLFLCDESLLADEIRVSHQAAELVGALSTDIRQSNVARVTREKETFSNKNIPLRTLKWINRNGLLVASLGLAVITGLIIHNTLIMSKVSRLHELAVNSNDQPEVKIIEESFTAEGSAITKKQGNSKVVGRVIGLQGIEWHQDQRKFSFGDSIREGERLQLELGSMEILLANGAKLTVDGPVDFNATSLDTMRLNIGKVVAAVPRTARGYTIVTPTTEVVDIGTQFGLSVDESGATEVHVFDGDVVARSLVDKKNSSLTHARENEAISFNSLSSIPKRFGIREADFVRWLGPSAKERNLPSIPVTDCLSLWYAADMITDTAEGESVSVWRDILVGDNRFANDARQFEPTRRPTYTIDDEKRCALHFNGTSTSLLIDPIEAAESCTIFLVCSPDQKVHPDNFHGNFIYKQGEAPSLEISVLTDHSARAWIWPGPNQERVGVVQSKAMSTNEPNVLAYRYDSTNSLAQLWANSVETETFSSPAKLSELTPIWLGSHSDPEIMAYFGGKIYEVIIYECALDNPSMQKVTSYLADRYRIDK